MRYQCPRPGCPLDFSTPQKQLQHFYYGHLTEEEQRDWRRRFPDIVKKIR